LGFLQILVYKEAQTQNYDPVRTSYTPFSMSVCHIVLYEL